MDVPRTLTEAQNAQPVIVIAQPLVVNAASNVRNIPYVELYSSLTGVHETPAQRLQRLAREDPGTEALI